MRQPTNLIIKEKKDIIFEFEGTYSFGKIEISIHDIESNEILKIPFTSVKYTRIKEEDNLTIIELN